MDESTANGLGALVFISLFYFIPSIISIYRHKSNGCAIFVLNLFLGWTVIGWIIALVWACIADSKPTVIQNNIEEKTEKSIQEQIEELAELKEKGLITQEEFEKKKTQILNIN
jgi:uncharacterized membrane protein